MIYLLHGEEFECSEAGKGLRAELTRSDVSGLNCVTLDGRYLTVADLRQHCDVVPFLSDKRVVIVRDLLARLDPRPAKGEAAETAETETAAGTALREELFDYLPHLPASTDLVLVESKALAKNNAILKYAKDHGEQISIQFFEGPSDRNLPNWIIRRVEGKEGRIQKDAADELARLVGGDLRLLDSEMDKLLAYTDGGEVRREDVLELVAPSREQEVWDFVDALGRQEANTALKLLHEQLAQRAAPLYLLTMIERQIRLLLQMRDYQSRGFKPDQAQQAMGLKYYPKKLWDQATKFTLDQLETMYRKVLDVEVEIKTSQVEGELALDVLAVELTRRPARS